MTQTCTIERFVTNRVSGLRCPVSGFADIHFGLRPWEKFFLGLYGIFSAIPRVATGKHWRAGRAVVPHNVEVNSRCWTFMALDQKRVKQHLCFLLAVEIHASLYCCFVPLHVGIFKKCLFWVSDSQPPAKGKCRMMSLLLSTSLSCCCDYIRPRFDLQKCQ